MIAALIVSLALSSKPSVLYRVSGRIPISGDGGWDYLTVDPTAQRLYISRGSHVQVLDLRSHKLVGDIPDTNGVHGIALAPKSGKGYISDGRDNAVTVFNMKTLATKTKISVGNRPDAIIYDSASNRVFTFNAGTSDSTAIDVKTDRVVGTVKLSGKPEFPQVDGHGHLFANIEDKSEIQKVDTHRLRVIGQWPLAPGESPSGQAIDTRDHVTFSTCDNNVMAISDYLAGKVVGTAKIGSGPDAGGFDSTMGYAFSSNGEDGTLTVIGKRSGKWQVLQTVDTQRSARTMALDPKTHRIYLICAKAEPRQGGGRPRLVPGSTVILIVSPVK